MQALADIGLSEIFNILFKCKHFQILDCREYLNAHLINLI